MTTKATFRDLIAWQKAVVLAKAVYQASQHIPATEKLGLTFQMRRAAVSVASNVAEGNARQSLFDYLRFLNMARGSLAELETQMIIAADLGMLKEPSRLIDSVRETRRILQGLIDSLRRKRQQTDPKQR